MHDLPRSSMQKAIDQRFAHSLSDEHFLSEKADSEGTILVDRIVKVLNAPFILW